MSEFKFEPKPPPEIPKSWQDMLEAALKKNGVKGCKALEGYWENATEEAHEEARMQADDKDANADDWIEANEEALTQSTIDCLVCNLQDMPKDDAMSQLVDIIAEVVL